MNLSEYISSDMLVRDAGFNTVGTSKSSVEGMVAYCDNGRYLAAIVGKPNVTAVITTAELSPKVPEKLGLVVCGHPRRVFYELMEALSNNDILRVDITAGCGKDCRIDKAAILAPGCRIGDRVEIGAGAIVHACVEIGDDVHIAAGVVLGGEGILYIVDDNGNKRRVRHAGGVRIGNGVSLFSGAVVIRSIHEHLLTSVGDCSIVGPRATVGHDAQVGRNCVISGNCVLARQAMIEDGAWIGSAAVIREYVRIGCEARVMAGSIVVRDVADGMEVSGNFAIDHRRHMRDFLKSSR